MKTECRLHGRFSIATSKESDGSSHGPKDLPLCENEQSCFVPLTVSTPKAALLTLWVVTPFKCVCVAYQISCILRYDS